MQIVFGICLVVLTCLSSYAVETQKEDFETDPGELVSYPNDIRDGDEVLTVETLFQPLLLNTMKREAVPRKRSTDYILKNLRFWTEANVAWQNFGAGDFQGFLPPSDDLIQSMQPYEVLSQSQTIHNHFRYNPPLLTRPVDVTLHRLLSMLHPRPFLYTRCHPHGMVACVMAANRDFLHISLRLHAEFQMNEPTSPPVWFVPSHLSGELIIERQSARVLHFHLAAPLERHPNAVIEWLSVAKETELGSLNEDIGYIAEMGLRSTRDSQPMYSRGRHIRKKYLNTTDDHTDLISNIQWEHKISQKEASLRILRHMYPFSKVKYHPFTTVWAEAKKLHKPVHFLVSQGYLDDQSACGTQDVIHFRELILENTGIMEILDQDFVSGWCVLNDLKVIESADPSTSTMKNLSKQYMDIHKFPIVAVVALSNGKVVQTMDVEGILYRQIDTIDENKHNIDFRDIAVNKYKKFLESSFEEATSEMNLENYNHEEL